jgi:hypothetical protein
VLLRAFKYTTLLSYLISLLHEQPVVNDAPARLFHAVLFHLDPLALQQSDEQISDNENSCEQKNSREQKKGSL